MASEQAPPLAADPGSAPALFSRIELTLGFAFWTLAGITALAAGPAAREAWLPFAVPVALLAAGWPLFRRVRRAGVVLDWLPLPFVVLTYAMLHKVVPRCWEATVDPWLRSADHAVFGGDLGVVLEPIVSRPFTVVMSAAYAAYYVLPVSAGVWFYARNRAAFRELMAGEVGALFIGYVGYLFLPAVGPYAHVAELREALPGDFIGEWIRHMVAFRDGTFPRDAFPSLHTANAVTILLVAWRHDRRVAAVYATPVLGLIAATMYLRFHYAVDVVAGIALAVAWQRAAIRLVAREAWTAETGVELQSPP